ncbi:MAG: MCE family protein [Desulfobacteraceae bacterium]|nr:MCE family protein [Desulfobacteraceae bacterium]
MEMEFTRLEKVVGTFIVCVVMLSVTTLVIIGRGKDWFENYITYYTTFNETYNIQENAAVKLFKADIGKVIKINLVENRVRVKLLIKAQYATRIRQNAVAVVESPTFIGSEYISIIPGSHSEEKIEADGEIPSREKRSFNDIMAEFEVEKTGKMVVRAIQNISDVAEQLSNDQGPLVISLANIKEISTNIRQITEDLKTGKGPVGTLLKSEQLLQQIIYNVDRMGEIIQNIYNATSQAPEIMTLVQNNLENYTKTGNLVRQRVDQTGVIISDIQKAAKNLTVIADNIKAGSGNIPRITTTFRDGVQEIREGVTEINRIVKALQDNMFIKKKLRPDPAPGNTDAGARLE